MKAFRMTLKQLTAGLMLIVANTAYSFDAGEHALLGDLAMAKYFPAFNDQITNLEADISFRYGSLIAMSGDMYKSVEELALDEPAHLKGFYLNNRRKLRDCIDKEVAAIRLKKAYEKCSELQIIKRKFRYLTLAHDNYTHFAWHNIKQYVTYHKKALWFAKLAHLKCSGKQQAEQPEICQKNLKQLIALVYASDYDKKLDVQYQYFKKLLSRRKLTKWYLINLPKEKTIDLALFTNAFADHFLTDAFSSGHLRVPRAQIDAFVEASDNIKRIKGKSLREGGSIISGALTQFLHNLDGNLDGLKVTNSRGDKFIARGDRQLFARVGSTELAGKPELNQQARIPVEAVAVSLKEVFQVISTGSLSGFGVTRHEDEWVGNKNVDSDKARQETPEHPVSKTEAGTQELPEAVYQALMLVPFVDEQHESSLAQTVKRHLKQTNSVSDALDTMSSEMKHLYRGAMLLEDQSYDQFFHLFSDKLSELMTMFKLQIVDEQQKSALFNHVPKPLLSAYKKIN